MADSSSAINRRIALQLMASAGVAATTLSLPRVVSAKQAKSSDESPPDNLTGTRFNLDEAHRVMTQLAIDALVLGDGRNFQQATGFVPVIAKMGWPTLNLAVLVRDPQPHVVIIMFAFSYYYMAADSQPFSDNDVFLYGGDNASQLTQDAALNSIRFHDRSESKLGRIENNRINKTKNTLQKNALHNSIGDALSAALKSVNLSKGRLGFDNSDIGQMLSQFVPNATLTTSDDALRRIRTIKSAIEIELMCNSSRINIESAHAACKKINAGATHKDLRRAFYGELVKRDAKGVFMVIDHVSDEQFDAELRQGQAFLIDCVGDYQGYLGDYGRTIFLGDVSKTTERAQITVGKAWDSLRAKLKPGLTFSEITALGQKAMSEQGHTYRVAFNPHSVGVFHSDHLGDGSSAWREDIVLRPGMIISVDCPVLESGIGGSVHLEDLMLITKDGAEPLHDTGNQAIYI